VNLTCVFFQEADCNLQFFVDGDQYDIYEYEHPDDKVRVTVSTIGRIEVLYPESGLSIALSMTYWNGCLLNSCITIPRCGDDIVGLLGNPDGNAANDWMTRDGTPVPIPQNDDLRHHSVAAFNYCQENWCIRDEAESLFTYNQVGLDYEDFAMCDLPFKTMIRDHILDKVTPEITEVCGEDIDCITDAVMGDIESARIAKNMRAGELHEECRPRGGECFDGNCCDGLVCRQNHGITGTICMDPDAIARQPECLLETAMCGPGKDPCCDGMICSERASGLSFCAVPPPACFEDGTECEADGECCGDAKCIGPDGDKACLVLPVENGVEKLPVGEECGFGIDCVNGATCVKNADLHICVEIPQCWATEHRNCDPADGMPGCCEDSGMACLPHRNTGRLLCEKLPECAPQWNSCEHVECCQEEGADELECKLIRYDGGVDKTMCVPKKCQPQYSFKCAGKNYLCGDKVDGSQCNVGSTNHIRPTDAECKALITEAQLRPDSIHSFKCPNNRDVSNWVKYDCDGLNGIKTADGEVETCKIP